MTRRTIQYECPVCGGEMRVRDSRYRQNEVKRRRHCMNCGERLTTIEVPAVEIELLRSPSVRHSMIRNHLASLASLTAEMAQVDNEIIRDLLKPAADKP